MNKNFNRIFAMLLCLCMVFSSLPMSALSAESTGENAPDGGETNTVCTKTEDCEAETHETDCPNYVAPGVSCDKTAGCTLAGGHEGDCVTAPAAPSAVDAIQALIDALPDTQTLAGMNAEQQNDVGTQVNAIYDAIDELTEGAETLDTAKLNAAAEWLSGQAAPMMMTMTVTENDDDIVISSDTTWNEAVTLTGSLTVSEGVTLTLNAQITITGNVTIKGGGTIIRGTDAGSVIMIQTATEGNVLTIDNVTLDGGAVWTGETNTTLRRGVVNSGVTALGNGSILWIRNSVVNLVNNTVVQNQCSGSAKSAAINIDNGTLNLNHAIIRCNYHSTERGGAIHVRLNTTINIVNSELYSNHSQGDGGAIGITKLDAGSSGNIVYVQTGTVVRNNLSGSGTGHFLYMRRDNDAVYISGGDLYANGGGSGYLILADTNNGNIVITGGTVHDNNCSLFSAATGYIVIAGNTLITVKTGYQAYNKDVITLSANGGTYQKGVAFAAAAPTIPVKTGYAFVGWYDNAELTGDKVTTVTAGSTYYAKWRVLTITFADKTGENAFTYDGIAKTLTATLEDDAAAVFSYTYAKRNADGTTYAEAVSTAPTYVGYYKVTASLTGSDRTATAYMEIKPVLINPTAAGGETLITGDENALAANSIIELGWEVAAARQATLSSMDNLPSGYNATTVFFELTLKVNGVVVTNPVFNRAVSVTVPFAVAANTLYKVAHLKSDRSVEIIDAVASVPNQTLTFFVTSLSPFMVLARNKVAPVITTTSLPNSRVNTPYTQTLTATGDGPVTWSIISGSLPAGLSLDSDTGVISGTPVSAGTSTFTIKASNGVTPDAVLARSIKVAAASSVPATGDDYGLWLWSSIALFTGAWLVGSVLLKNKKRRS